MKKKDKKKEELINSTEKERDISALSTVIFQNPNASVPALRELFQQETGRSITLDSVRKYKEEILRRRPTNKITASDDVIDFELRRLDAFEQTLWDAFEVSKMSKKREVIEKVARESKDDPGLIDLIVRNVKVYKEFGPGDIKILQQIADVQKERRKLVGAYAAGTMQHNVEVRIVKGFIDISPSDWDEGFDE